MTIEAEIHALVGSFVDDLEAMVHAAANAAIEEAFQQVDFGAPRRPPRRAAPPAKRASRPRVASAASTAAPAPAKTASSLEIWPSSKPAVAAAAPKPEGPPVVRRFPPKRPRANRGSAASASPKKETVQPVPAKSWVVVRRKHDGKPSGEAPPASAADSAAAGGATELTAPAAAPGAGES